MKNWLKKYFIPHEGNDYKPHMLRESAVCFIAFIIVAVFLSSLSMKTISNNNPGLGAAVISGVLVDLSNQDRSANNLGTLRVNDKLVAAANLKASDMATYSYFAHTSPAGVSPWFWFKKAGYQFTDAGENLAVNFTESKDVETAWMNSPLHRANILSPDFHEIGIATIDGTYQGRPTTFVVQEFGTPAMAVASTPATKTPTVTATTPTKVPTTTPAVVPGKVKGEAVSVAPEQEVKVVKEEGNFVEVKATDPTLIPAPITPEDTTVSHVSWLDRFFVSPSLLMKTVYLVLAAIILIATLLHIFIVIKRQHLPSILYGVSILGLMGALYAFFIGFFGVSFIFA